MHKGTLPVDDDAACMFGNAHEVSSAWSVESISSNETFLVD